MMAYSDLVKTEIALSEAKVPEEKKLEDAVQVFASEKNSSYELQANTVLLRVLTAQGKQEKSRQLIQMLTAEVAAQRNTNFGFSLDARLAIEEASWRRQTNSEAEAKLQDIIAVSTQHGYSVDRLAAQAILAKLEIEAGNTNRGERLLSAVRSEAAQKNLVLVVNMTNSHAYRRGALSQG